MMERIVYLDRSLLPTAVRRPTFEHEWIEQATSRPEEVKARLEGATVAITHRVFLRAEDLPPLLRLIAVGATGAERIDLTACRARGVHVCNVYSGPRKLDHQLRSSRTSLPKPASRCTEVRRVFPSIEHRSSCLGKSRGSGGGAPGGCPNDCSL